MGVVAAPARLDRWLADAGKLGVCGVSMFVRPVVVSLPCAVHAEHVEPQCGGLTASYAGLLCARIGVLLLCIHVSPCGPCHGHVHAAHNN
jgi:hypothetical protein